MEVCSISPDDPSSPAFDVPEYETAAPKGEPAGPEDETAGPEDRTAAPEEETAAPEEETGPEYETAENEIDTDDETVLWERTNVDGKYGSHNISDRSSDQLSGKKNTSKTTKIRKLNPL